jgi:hypothetical protein
VSFVFAPQLAEQSEGCNLSSWRCTDFVAKEGRKEGHDRKERYVPFILWSEAELILPKLK